jgi:hypothetical protein
VVDLVNTDLGVLPSRFEMVSSLGAGGMGEVYVVRDRESDAQTALKLLARPGGAAAALFRNEFRCLSDLRHPNLVRLGELFDLGDRLCFTMELVDGIHFDDWASPEHGGDTASDAITRRRDPASAGGDGEPHGDLTAAPRYDESHLRDALAQLADGLAAIHGAGLVHRDLKPTNVMVTRDGRVVLLDFGIAILARDRHESGIAVGTAVYMAPEQARAESPEAAVDLYALGIMLYEVLVGRPPFLGEDLDILQQKQRNEPTRPRALYPETPVDLDVLCMDLLAREPARRPTALEVAARLRNALRAAAPAMPYSARARAQTEVFVGRNAELAALAAGLAAAGSGPVLQLVLGGTGIGKTTLLGRFALAARDRARLISVGRCHQREHVRLDLWDALMEAITRDLAALPRDQRARLLPRDVAALVCAFPVFERLAPRAPAMSVPAAELAQRALAALRELLVRLGDGQPVVMIVDDAQWASEDSLDLLPALLASPGPRLCIVLAARPATDAAALLPGRLALLAAGGVDVRTVELGPLADDDALVLARHLSPSRAHAIAAAAHGRPLFLELLAAGAATADAASVARAIAARIAALPPAEREAVALVAAAAGPVRHDVLARVLGSAPASALARVAELRLVRTTGWSRIDFVEPLHDAVRVAALAGLDEETRRSLRVQLAMAIDADVASDPLLRCVSWVQAGDGPRAAAAARALVGQARDGLAFARAARACESVLELPLSAPERASLGASLGEALAGAGKGARAADAFREAAAVAAGAAQLALAGRAAELDLQAGHVERGLAIATPVAAALGLPLTGSARGAATALFVERGRLALRGLVPRKGLVDEDAGARADTCHSLANGLAMVDARRASWFQTRALRHALDSGAPGRIARGLAIEASFVAFSRQDGGATRTGTLLRWAGAFAARVGSADLDGVIASRRGLCDHARGDHAAALAGFDAARALFRERCRGAIWEDHGTEVFALWSLAWLGRWDELAMRREVLTREAAASDDLVAVTCASIGLSLHAEIGRGRAAEAGAQATAAIARWGRSDVQMPHLHALIGATSVDLALGRGADAHRRLVERWPALIRSSLLRGAWAQAITCELRARAALAAGALAAAAGHARRLARWPWLAGPALLVRGQLAAAHGRPADAAALLAQAVPACEAAALALHAAAALDRHGLLVGGDLGRAARTEAARRARQRGVSCPEPAFALLAPLPPDAAV